MQLIGNGYIREQDDTEVRIQGAEGSEPDVRSRTGHLQGGDSTNRILLHIHVLSSRKILSSSGEVVSMGSVAL